jgi:hypothetical protein
MRLTPVGSPPPPWPGDAEFKPAIGMWVWNPTFGELRIETNASIFREAIASIWDECRVDPRAAQDKQPVVRFVDRVSVTKKAIGKSFFSPLIKVIGWVERDKVPGWANREPTVAPPAAPPLLAASSAPAPTPATPAAKKPAKVTPKAKPSAPKT